MASDAELRDQAVAHLKQTTTGYLKSNGQPKPPPWPEGSTHWKSALDLLGQIGQTTPVPPPPGTAYDDVGDFAGAFLPEWSSPVATGVSKPAGLGGGIFPQDTPYGKGFRIRTTDAMKTVWDANMKTCALQGANTCQKGRLEDWHFAFMLPKSGNPNGIGNGSNWNGMVLWECGHTKTSSGHKVAIDGRWSSGVPGHLGLWFGRNRAPWGVGDYEMIKIEDPQFDKWYVCRQLVKWDDGPNGSLGFWCNDKLIHQYTGATMPPNDVPYLILCNYSDIVGLQVNEVVIGGVTRS